MVLINENSIAGSLPCPGTPELLGRFRTGSMGKRVRGVFLLCSLVALNACAIAGPDYHEPELGLPEVFESSDDFEQSESAENIAWWKHFDDPVLDALVLQAAEQNKDVRQALSRINQSRALARVAFSELLPGALLNGSYEKGKSSGARFPSGGGGGFDFEVYQGSVDALWEIDIFGRLQRELEARNAEHNASVASLGDTLLMTIAEIGNSYVAFRSAELQLDIAKKNEKLQAELLELTETKFKFGQVSELDVTRAKTQLAQTRALIPQIHSLETTQLNRLCVLVGQNPGTLREKLDTSQSLPNYDGPISIGSPKELLRRRPDLRQAERMLASKTARIGVAAGELYPKITISGSLGVEAATFSRLDNGARTYNFGPQISWAAFDTGRLRAGISVAEEAAQEALLAFEQAVLLALEDVQNSLSNYRAEKLRLGELQVAFETSQKSYELARLQYNEGALDFISVLDTQRTLLETENNYVQSKERLSLALISIYKALGGGWQAFTLE